MSASELGSNIKYFRELKGWSLNKLKQESQVGYSTLHDIENGKSQSLSSVNLEKVAKALHVDTNDLLGIDVIEVTVNDLRQTLKSIFLSDELSIDGKVLTYSEKEIAQDLVSICMDNIESIIRRRRKEHQNDSSSNL